MATITPVSPSLSGAASTSHAAETGDQVENPVGAVVILATNNSGGSMTVTASAPSPAPVRDAGGGFPPMPLQDLVVTVPNGESRLVGPLPLAFNNSNGRVALAYSTTTSVTIRAFNWR